MDVDAIEPGLPFDEVIDQAVGRCEILLAMIGKHWMEQQPGVGPRINDEKDYVRPEIAAALSRNVRVIPVLLDGAGMPTEAALPEPLRALARRNSIEISNSRFNSDVDRLVEAVSKVLGESNVPPSQERSRSHRTMQYWLLGVFIVVALFSLIAYFYSPTKISMVGSWEGGTDCILVFYNDDGKHIKGSCDTPSGIRHKVTGSYTDSNNIGITITRTDQSGCVATTRGYLKIIDIDHFKAAQEGWHECKVKTESIKDLLWTRSRS